MPRLFPLKPIIAVFHLCPPQNVLQPLKKQLHKPTGQSIISTIISSGGSKKETAAVDLRLGADKREGHAAVPAFTKPTVC
jgi:hypothetical protein